MLAEENVPIVVVELISGHVVDVEVVLEDFRTLLTTWKIWFGRHCWNFGFGSHF
jgi:hypothetical protein